MTDYATIGRATGWPLLCSTTVAILLGFSGFASAAQPAGLLAASAVGQATGTIKGRLVWGGETLPPVVDLVEKGKAAQNPDICAKDQKIISHALEVDPKSKGVAYGFAYLVRPKGANPQAIKDLVARQPSLEVDQKNCDFLPHSIAMVQDQTLTMKSSDAAGHNVHVTGFSNGLNQSIPPNGKLDVKLVAERRPIMLQCDIHPWMHGHILVLDHPYFAVTGLDGSFEIKGVPAGSQNVVVWQERVGFVTPGMGSGMPVKVVADEVADVGEIKIDPAKVK